MTPPHAQSVWGSRGKKARAAELSVCCNYLLKRKKVYNVAPSTLTTMSIYIIYVVKVLVAIITSA